MGKVTKDESETKHVQIGIATTGNGGYKQYLFVILGVGEMRSTEAL